MANRIHFSKTDIGGELLPILTMGLYRDTLDSLREYIQNAIDANPTKIRIFIDPDSVAVVDDGDGMNAVQARKALRLGISEKNPTHNIGFRGIGIYSGFNLCNLLEIYTKAEDATTGYYLRFDFKKIRTHLLEDQERRKNSLPSKMHLEELLEGAVFVEEDQEGVAENKGTKVIMSGMLPDSYERLQQWEKVESYLQDNVPLPFDPDFKYAKALEKKFSEEDYRVVPLSLQINSERAQLYRPYTNELFTKGGLHKPKYFTVGKGDSKFGFAWVCINDERKVLKNASLRGLLIKKFGFSISTRAYLEPFFQRTVFNRRISGEIIIQNQNLLPNAARSDFEHNSARHGFLQAISEFIKQLSAWANAIQQEDKAREILEEAAAELGLISQELPAARRDKDKILEYNVRLAAVEDKLKVHKKTLDSLNNIEQLYSDTQQALKECKEFVKNAVSETAASYKRLESNVKKTIQVERALKSHKSNPKPSLDLVSIIEGAGIQLTDDVRRAFMLFESECLLAHFDRETYASLLLEFKDILEEKF